MEIPGKNKDMTSMNNQWKIATLIDSKMVSSNVKSLTFKVENWEKPQAGQHYNIKLTSEDGYSAERDYSLASTPEDKGIVELGIQLIEDGEVSPYLFQVEKDDQIEIKGPIGHHFIWDTNMQGPLVLIGGGSGTVPLRSIINHHFNNYTPKEVILLNSAKTLDHVLYFDEFQTLSQKYSDFKFIITLTQQTPPNWTGYSRRIDQQILSENLSSLKDKMPLIYICGPTNFVESVADNLVSLGFNTHQIKTERFG